MNRRDFLGGVAITGLSGCAPNVRKAATPPGLPLYGVLPELMPIRAQVDRIFRVTVCLRPFRAAGPRLDVERVGDKTVVHNYGHGGSGWSPVVGIEQYRGRESDGGRRAGRGRHWMRCVGADLGDSTATLGRQGYYLCQGAPTGGAIRASNRNLVARLTGRVDELCVTRFSSTLGEDVPIFVSYL